MKDIKFCVLDIETTGLDPDESRILEIGVALLDRNLQAVDTFESLVTDVKTMTHIAEIRRDVWERNGTEDELKRKAFILNMHSKSGLYADIAASAFYRSVEDVEELICDFLYRNGLRDSGLDDNEDEGIHVHLAGSSLHFDVSFLQKFMPSVVGHFHHRRLDVSGAKVIVDTWLPNQKQMRDAMLRSASKHRAMSDVVDSIAELTWYLENSFHVSNFIEAPTHNPDDYRRPIKDAPQA